MFAIRGCSPFSRELAEQIPAADGTKRVAYRLTKKGTALRPVLESIRDWGLKWEPGTKAMLSSTSPRDAK